LHFFLSVASGDLSETINALATADNFAQDIALDCKSSLNCRRVGAEMMYLECNYGFFKYDRKMASCISQAYGTCRADAYRLKFTQAAPARRQIVDWRCCLLRAFVSTAKGRDEAPMRIFVRRLRRRSGDGRKWSAAEKSQQRQPNLLRPRGGHAGFLSNLAHYHK
jgi:hypothetical protein